VWVGREVSSGRHGKCEVAALESVQEKTAATRLRMPAAGNVQNFVLRRDLPDDAVTIVAKVACGTVEIAVRANGHGAEWIPPIAAAGKIV